MSNLRKFDELFAETNRLRTEGADNLLASSAEARVARTRGDQVPRNGGDVGVRS